MAVAKRPAASFAKRPAAVAKRPAASPAPVGKRVFVRKKPAAANRGSSAPSDDQPLPSAVVLNLKRRPDRWESVKTSLQRLKGLQFERVEAIDGADLTQQIPNEVVARTWSTAVNQKYVSRVFEGGEEYGACDLPLTAGERGCAASHVSLWKRCAAGSSPLLVLEDDAKPKAGFMPRLRRALAEVGALQDAPDVLYLGYTQAAPWRGSFRTMLKEAEYVWTTVVYLLWPSGARKLLTALPVNQPVDNFMAGLIASRRLRGFVVAPPLVDQAGEWNESSDIAHSDEAAWANS